MMCSVIVLIGNVTQHGIYDQHTFISEGPCCIIIYCTQPRSFQLFARNKWLLCLFFQLHMMQNTTPKLFVCVCVCVFGTSIAYILQQRNATANACSVNAYSQMAQHIFVKMSSRSTYKLWC